MRNDHATIGQNPSEAEHLLSPPNHEIHEMADLNTMREIDSSSPSPPPERGSTEEQNRGTLSEVESQILFMEVGGMHVVYKVYRRRWFGLIQLVLLNIVVSWDVRATRVHPKKTITKANSSPSGYLSPQSQIPPRPTSPQQPAL